MVKRLERKGLVKRLSCTEDARSKRVTLTEKSRLPLASEAEIYSVVADKLRIHLNEQEFALLDTLLTKALR